MSQQNNSVHFLNCSIKTGILKISRDRKKWHLIKIFQVNLIYVGRLTVAINIFRRNCNALTRKIGKNIAQQNEIAGINARHSV